MSTKQTPNCIILLTNLVNMSERLAHAMPCYDITTDKINNTCGLTFSKKRL